LLDFTLKFPRLFTCLIYLFFLFSIKLFGVELSQRRSSSSPFLASQSRIRRRGFDFFIFFAHFLPPPEGRAAGVRGFCVCGRESNISPFQGTAPTNIVFFEFPRTGNLSPPSFLLWKPLVGKTATSRRGLQPPNGSNPTPRYFVLSTFFQKCSGRFFCHSRCHGMLLIPNTGPSCYLHPSGSLHRKWPPSLTFLFTSFLRTLL